MKTLPEKINALVEISCIGLEDSQRKKIAQTVYKMAVLLNGLSKMEIIIILRTLKKLTAYFCFFNSSSNTEPTDL